MTAPQTHLDLHDIVNELTTSHTHREPYETTDRGTVWTLHHATSVPSLVEQLLAASPSGQGNDRSGRGYESRPAAPLEALDTLMLIDDEAARWIRRLGHDDPGNHLDHSRSARPENGSGTIACLKMLHGLHAAADACRRPHGRRTDAGWCCPRHHIEADFRRWWRQARIVSGWDTPAAALNNTCPVCDHRGGLRIRAVEKIALCVECRTSWTPDDIGLLAQHIRWENQDDDADAS